MPSNQNSTPLSAERINFASTASSTRGFGSYPPSIDTTSSPLPASSGHHNFVSEYDTVIAVMGLTGSGKSSFVNMAAGRVEVVIGHNLNSQTRGIQAVRCIHPDRRRNIVLVDTPGFDNTHRSDFEALKTIAHWLKETYQNNIRLTGILYLHRISDVRMAGTSLRNLAMFRDLCGDNNLKNVILVTTMWDAVEDQLTGSKREAQLRSSFWKSMIDQGSCIYRFEGTHESAWDIIECLDLEVPHQKRTPLQIQREMVDKGIPFHRTTAANTLHRFLVRIEEEIKKVWEKLRSRSRKTG